MADEKLTIDNVTKEWIEEQYKTRSFADMAEELGTYTNAVRRKAIKLGVEPRKQSAAQKLALKEGRREHPTKGKKRSEKVKIAISEKMTQSWANLSKEKLEERIQKSRDAWNEMSQAEKDAFHAAAHKAIRKTSKEGSNLEKFIVESLKSKGIVVEFHKKDILANAALEIDIFLPDKSIAIEVDGPSHFLPIWGEEELRKTVKADNEKNALLIALKVHVIRIKFLKRFTSKKDLRDVMTFILESIQEISSTNEKATMHVIEVK